MESETCIAVGDPIAGMTVTDRTQKVSQSFVPQRPMPKAYFRFSTQGGKGVYCIRFDHLLWNLLQVTVRLDKHAHQHGITAKDMAVGGLSPIRQGPSCN
jgi:hypothetical protein